MKRISVMFAIIVCAFCFSTPVSAQSCDWSNYITYELACTEDGLSIPSEAQISYYVTSLLSTDYMYLTGSCTTAISLTVMTSEPIAIEFEPYEDGMRSSEMFEIPDYTPIIFGNSGSSCLLYSVMMGDTELYQLTPTLDYDLLPHRVHVKVVNLDNDPVYIAKMGCDWSDYPPPTGYGSIQMCTNCTELLCVFGSGEMYEVEGAYVVAGPGQTLQSMAQNPTSAVYGQYQVGDDLHAFGMWYTNAAAPDNDWETIYEITFTVNSHTTTPTPGPTPTPIPTMTPPPPASVEMLSEGFGAGFEENYGVLSSYGILGNWAYDVDRWLFYARKTVLFVNAGNLLYVVVAVGLAVLILGWAFDQVKNPR